MHGDRPADAPDLHEEVDELGPGREQLRELVDDDDEARHRLEVGAGPAGGLIVVAVLEVACGAEHLHAAVELAADRVGHPLDEAQLVGQVGDDGGDVRQVLQPEECGAALEVDEDEIELLGGVRHGEPEHQRAQQLRLAGAGGADADAVWTHAALGRLLEVELDGAAVVRCADRDAELLAQRSGAPGDAGVERQRVAGAEQRREVADGLESGVAGRDVAVLRVGEPVGRHGAGQHLAVHGRHAVGSPERGAGVRRLLGAAVQDDPVGRDLEHRGPRLESPRHVPLAGDVQGHDVRCRRQELPRRDAGNLIGNDHAQ